MDEQTFLKRYSYYYSILQRLGRLCLLVKEKPTIEKMELSKGMVQHIYAEIKEQRLRLSLWDYLYYISTCFIVREAKKFNDGFILASQFVLSYPAELDRNNLLYLFVRNPSYYFGEIDPDSSLEEKVLVGKMFAEYWMEKLIKNG